MFALSSKMTPDPIGSPLQNLAIGGSDLAVEAYPCAWRAGRRRRGRGSAPGERPVRSPAHPTPNRPGRGTPPSQAEAPRASSPASLRTTRRRPAADEHGEHDEERILGAPGRRRLTKQQILEGRRAERLEPRINACDVGVEELAIRGRSSTTPPAAPQRGIGGCGFRGQSARPERPTSAASSPAARRRDRSI